MTLRAKHQGRLRIVSKAMARRLRSRGVKVLDDAAPTEPSDESGSGYVSDDEARAMARRPLEINGQSAPVPHESHAAEFAAALSAPAEEPMVDTTANPGAIVEVLGSDLTDEELERLTAPHAEVAPAVPARTTVSVDSHLSSVRRCSACGETGHTKRNCPTGDAGGSGSE